MSGPRLLRRAGSSTTSRCDMSSGSSPALVAAPDDVAAIAAPLGASTSSPVDVGMSPTSSAAKTERAKEMIVLFFPIVFYP
jgi:hypothetical protein